MKHIGIGLSNIAMCGLIGYAIYLTKNPNCLWALFFVISINEILANSN
jgi:hypothetical protein